MTEPLNLPRGSVRAILTIVVVVFAGLTLFIPIASGAGDARTLFVGAAAMIVKDYFTHRKDENEKAGPPLSPPSFEGE